MDKQKIITIVIGAICTVASAVGILDVEEGTQLTAFGTSAVTGICGIISIITAVIKRKKGNDDEDSDSNE